MQILGLLDIYFDFVVVFVKKNALLITFAIAIVLCMYYTFLLLGSLNSQN